MLFHFGAVQENHIDIVVDIEEEYDKDGELDLHQMNQLAKDEAYQKAIRVMCKCGACSNDIFIYPVL